MSTWACAWSVSSVELFASSARFAQINADSSLIERYTFQPLCCSRGEQSGPIQDWRTPSLSQHLALKSIVSSSSLAPECITYFQCFGYSFTALLWPHAGFGADCIKKGIESGRRLWCYWIYFDSSYMNISNSGRSLKLTANGKFRNCHVIFSFIQLTENVIKTFSNV